MDSFSHYHRATRLNPAEAARLGVPENMFARLKSGHEVELPNGRRVQPAEVISQPQPGRVLYYSGCALHGYMMELAYNGRRELDSVALDLPLPNNQVEIAHFLSFDRRLILCFKCRRTLPKFLGRMDLGYPAN